ncbi:MAG TPA: CorA family divalent cation transporter [Pirellulales bacterium]|nr:CorA family divalent cation transporter [Pirellulales bacterium]
MTSTIAKSVLPTTWKVPEIFRTRLGESAGRQRSMAADGHLLIVLHELPKPTAHERTGRLFWREPDGQWKSNSQGSGIQALKRHLTDYADEVTRLEGQVDQAASAEDYFAVLQAAAPLFRAARNMHAALQQARELTPADRDLVLMRDRAVEIERAAELVHGDAKNGLDFTVARQSEEQAQRSYEMAVSAHRLNILAAIFLPVATLSAIFGMNLDHGLEINGNPAAFWIVLAAGFIVGVLLTGILTNAPTQPSTPSVARSSKKFRRR